MSLIMSAVHRILRKHEHHTISKEGEPPRYLLICGQRFGRRCNVWYRPAPGALWEEVGDVGELRGRLGLDG